MNMHVKTPYSENKVSQSEIDFQLDYCQSEIEGILKYKFGDPSYLLQANFLHRMLCVENTKF